MPVTRNPVRVRLNGVRFRRAPSRRCDSVHVSHAFSQGSTACLRSPHPPGSLAWLSWIVARHGGWNVAGKPPGAKTMARGWKRFAALLAGALLATQDSLPQRP